MVDGLVLLPLYLLDKAIHEITQVQWVVFIYFLMSLQIGWLYTTLLHGWRGQTVGKSSAGIIVVRHKSGESIGFRRAALRDAPYIVLIAICSGVWVYANVAWFRGWYSDHHDRLVDRAFMSVLYINVGWCLLELLSMLLHPQRRAIHDLIAGTVVIEKLKAA